MTSPANMTKTFMNLSKTQYYGSDGTGRDMYIYNNIGGFAPEHKGLKCEDIGKLTTPPMAIILTVSPIRLFRSYQAKTKR